MCSEGSPEWLSGAMGCWGGCSPRRPGPHFGAKTLRVEVKRWRNSHQTHEASHTSLDNKHVLQAGNSCTWGRPQDIPQGGESRESPRFGRGQTAKQRPQLQWTRLTSRSPYCWADSRHPGCLGNRKHKHREDVGELEHWCCRWGWKMMWSLL